MGDLSSSIVDDMTEWRHAFHSDPEFGLDTHRTARFVADRLRDFGFDEVVEGVGVTGVVGTLRRGNGNRAIALRADMDALRIHERRDCAYRSRNDGFMHACGHDGHTAMLLGAAKQLAREGGFSGTVHFVFQPAEEWGKGALAMLDDGLLDRFPFDEIYGIHNLPGLPVGHFATRAGGLMAAEDNFEILVEGLGGHASSPHRTHDALVSACALVTALQTIVSRSLDPADTAVVSVTELVADGTRNVLPGSARILGDCRSFRPEVSEAIEDAMRRIAVGVAAAHGTSANVTYTREFVPLINEPGATKEAVAAAEAVAGTVAVDANCTPITASEDFAQFLAKVPGCFVFLGNGESSLPLHNSGYDFNDRALAAGAEFHVQIARRRLSHVADGPRSSV